MLNPFPIVESPPAIPRPSRCVLVTGPRGAGKTRWIQQQIVAVTGNVETIVSCGVLLLEEGRTRMENFVAGRPSVTLRKLMLPCPCCPALAGLPATARSFLETAAIDWLFVEMPMDAASGLLEDFDRELGWRRSLVVCLNPAWSSARQRQAFSPFQTNLLRLADDVVGCAPHPPSLPSLYDSP